MQCHRLFFSIIVATAMVAATAAAFGGASDPPSKGEVKQASFRTITNVPDKSLVAIEVLYPPGGVAPMHLHSSSAFLYAYVLSGSVASKGVDGAERVFNAGESFNGALRGHHQVSRNASNSEPAKLLAVFVMDSSSRPTHLSTAPSLDQPYARAAI